jgi:hypothetical protein
MSWAQADDLSAQPTGSIPLACGGWPETKAAYRLLDVFAQTDKNSYRNV